VRLNLTPHRSNPSPATLQPFAFAASRTLAISTTLNVSPLIKSLAPLTKWKLALGSFNSGSPFRLMLTATPMILLQCRGQHLGLRAFHLDIRQGQRRILADRFLPVRTGRRIDAQHIVAAIGMVELDEGGAAVARVQLHAVIGGRA